jgi:glycolate oxidase iron-sulfur subunit
MTVVQGSVPRGFSSVDAPDASIVASCVHCGLCLNECPTYRVLRVEMDSPRGRIQMVNAVQDERLALDSAAFLKHTFQCLDCRGCETACPSGVKYGALIEAVRAQTVQASLLPTRRRLAQLVLRIVFRNLKFLRLAAQGLRIYQRSGLQTLMRRLGVLQRVLPPLAAVEALSPRISDNFLQASDLSFVPAEGEVRHRVSFVTGCIMAVAFADAHRASLRVLARNGCDIRIPEQQGCCGALHVHGGDREAARELARRNIHAFEVHDEDAIIINSAGCGSTLKEYGELLADDPLYAARAEAFSLRVKDFSEYLHEIGPIVPTRSISERVVYQDACHLVHAQGISRQPRELLGAVPGIELIEMENPTICCGAAGLYSVTDTEISLAILNERLDAIEATGATVVVSTNPGCLLHIQTGAQKRGLNLRVMHLAEFLDGAYDHQCLESSSWLLR